MRRGTALLPATQCLFNKNKATLDDIASVWAPCIVQVMDREHNGKVATRFVVGCGDSLNSYDREFTAIHDQTSAYLGEFTQFAVVRLDKDGKVVEMKMGDRPIPASAPVLVYK